MRASRNSTAVSAVAGKAVTTIEGLDSAASHAVQAAWREPDVVQCGYCQSGMIMAVEALLNEIAEPTDDDINQKITNICRCGTYQRVRAAIKRAAEARS